jgi:hypothetical protein
MSMMEASFLVMGLGPAHAIWRTDRSKKHVYMLFIINICLLQPLRNHRQKLLYSQKKKQCRKRMSEKTKDLWVERARNVLKGELARRGLSYEDLAIKLKQIGIDENANNLRSKINRGTFSAAFFLQVLSAIGCRAVDIQIEP